MQQVLQAPKFSAQIVQNQKDICRVVERMQESFLQQLFLPADCRTVVGKMQEILCICF